MVTLLLCTTSKFPVETLNTLKKQKIVVSLNARKVMLAPSAS